MDICVIGTLTILTIQYHNGCLAASDLFHMFTQRIKVYTFHYDVLKSTDV